MAAANSFPKYIVVGIDGTSSSSWRKPDGSNSHVYCFVRDFQYGAMGVDRLYLDGPSDVISGRDSEPLLQKALDFLTRRIQTLFPENAAAGPHQALQPLEMFDVNSCQQTEYYRQQYQGSYDNAYPSSVRMPAQVNAGMLAHQPLSTDQVRVVLVGHSRGGLVTTVLARMLSPLVRVYFMGLYDSVDREPCLDGSLIENTRIVFHARRSPEVGSRGTFGNTSTQYRVDHYEEQFFYTSHGGIGGDFIADARAVPAFGDSSCTARPDTRIVNMGRGGTAVVDNRHLLTRRFNRPIDQICAEGRDQADAFIRNGAKRFGLPLP